MQKLSIYQAGKVQFQKTISNIHQGLSASYDKAQLTLNRMREKVLRENRGKLNELFQKSKYGNLLSSGASGRSISRIGVMEMGALGRFYAQKAHSLTNAREDFMTGVKKSRLKGKAAQDQAFSKVWAQPTTDVAPPKPVMQNVGLALFGDALGLAGTIASISDSRLKEDIKKIGVSIGGHNIYKFKYLDDPTEYIGAMAEDVLKVEPSAVSRMPNGYLGVDYSKIDVEMKEVA